ncbi:MAG: type II toxin-antitoxin system RelE/ParE family toxin [Candidatus Competibacteraceae bacterium]
MNYRIEVSSTAQYEIKHLPGHVRQRVRRAIKDFAANPRPPHSKRLDFDLPGAEPRRLRLEHWRIIYVVIDDIHLVAVVGVRRHPPYAYADLPELSSDVT